MTEELVNPKTLDLVGVLSGRDYPTLDIEVYFNETLGFAIYEMLKMQRSVEVLGTDEEVKSLHENLKELVEKSESEKYTLTLKAVPEEVYRGIVNKVAEEHPDETDLLGRPKPNPKGDQEFTRNVWRAYLTKITGPEGNSKIIDAADVDALLGKAPATVHAQITGAIKELREGAKAGFEYAAKGIDFLSQASPEG